jgi:hypothetical protein
MHTPFAVVHALFALFAVAPTGTALAHNFNPGRSSTEPAWHTSQRIYPSHSNHTHMLNATEAEVHRLAQRAGLMSTSSLPPALLPPPLPPSLNGHASTTPKEGAMVSAMVPSFANSSGQWQRALPRFDSLKDLCAEPFWKGYLDAVYGGALDFPIDLRRFWFFYINYLHIRPPASLPFISTELKMPADDDGAFRTYVQAMQHHHHWTGRKHLDAYQMTTACSKGGAGAGCGRAVVWIYMFLSNGSTEVYGAAGVADHTRVEVYHCGESKDGAVCNAP